MRRARRTGALPHAPSDFPLAADGSNQAERAVGRGTSTRLGPSGPLGWLPQCARLDTLAAGHRPGRRKPILNVHSYQTGATPISHAGSEPVTPSKTDRVAQIRPKRTRPPAGRGRGPTEARIPRPRLRPD